MIEFRESRGRFLSPTLLVIDAAEDEEIGQIYWSKQNNQFAFALTADEIFTSELIEIAEKMKELTKKRASQMVLSR